MAEIPQEEPNLKVPPPVDKNLVGLAATVVPTVVGCGIGILMGAQLSKRGREAIATSLFALGAMAAAPVAVDCVARLIKGPASRIGTQKTLQGIRHSDGVPYEDATTAAQVEDYSQEFRAS